MLKDIFEKNVNKLQMLLTSKKVPLSLLHNSSLNKNPMHTIFITLEEFLANGGTLEFERDLFMQTGDRSEFGATYKRVGWACPNDHRNIDLPEGMVRVHTHQRSYGMNNFMLYVSIQATPIYK